MSVKRINKSDAWMYDNEIAKILPTGVSQVHLPRDFRDEK